MFNDVVDVAVHRGRNIAATVADAMVGDAVLWEVVGADLFATVAAADEVTTFGGKLGVFLVDFLLEEA